MPVRRLACMVACLQRPQPRLDGPFLQPHDRNPRPALLPVGAICREPPYDTQRVHSDGLTHSPSPRQSLFPTVLAQSTPERPSLRRAQVEFTVLRAGRKQLHEGGGGEQGEGTRSGLRVMGLGFRVSICRVFHMHGAHAGVEVCGLYIVWRA